MHGGRGLFLWRRARIGRLGSPIRSFPNFGPSGVSERLVVDGIDKARLESEDRRAIVVFKSPSTCTDLVMMKSPSAWALLPIAAAALFLYPPTESATPAPTPVVFDSCQGCTPLGEDVVMDAVFFEDGSNIFVAAVPAQGFCMGMLTGDLTIVCMGDQCSVEVEYNTY